MRIVIFPAVAGPSRSSGVYITRSKCAWMLRQSFYDATWQGGGLMILIGGGALLSRAAAYAKRSGLAVDFVCCPPKDLSCIALKRLGIPFNETSDPNNSLVPILKECSDNVAFSINNQHILGDALLSAGVSFFNIHSGLVQKYRGRAEVCMFIALCRGERRYGATLHRILPKQGVDAGPVIAQLAFEVSDRDRFADVLTKTVTACQSIFEANVSRVLTNNFTTVNVPISERPYSYKDLAKICREANPARLARASDFGDYAESFPRLKSTLESILQSGEAKNSNAQ